MIVQVGVVALAQTVQIAVVRYTPPRGRRIVWVALRLGSALTLAVLWMTGTWILRTPRALADAVAPWHRVIAWTPGAELVRPLVALRLGAPVALASALAVLAAGALAALALAYVVGRRAGMHGWEEAGASWAEANARVAPASRPITIATKDLRLILRDRSQLLALVTAPVIFVGIQIFGAAGWAWSTASLQRVAVLSFSLCLYMATIGPLVHMQAERRSFWILRTVPVSIGRLMFAKARAWALVLGVLSAGTFLSLSAGVAGATLPERLALAGWVAAGAAGMAFVAVGLACQAADLLRRRAPGDRTRDGLSLPARRWALQCRARREQHGALALGRALRFRRSRALVVGHAAGRGVPRPRALAPALGAPRRRGDSGAAERAPRPRHPQGGSAGRRAAEPRDPGRAARGRRAARARDRALPASPAGQSSAPGSDTVVGYWRRYRRRRRLGAARAGVVLVRRGGREPSVDSGRGADLRGTVQRALEERWPRRRLAAAALGAAIAFLATPGPWAFVLAGAVAISALRAATGRTAPGFLARATFVLLLAAR